MPEDLIEIDEATLRQMRWQASPLRKAIDEVTSAAKARYQQKTIPAIGSNRATFRIVHAASELAEIQDEIIAGTRDAMGYEIEAGQ